MCNATNSCKSACVHCFDLSLVDRGYVPWNHASGILQSNPTCFLSLTTALKLRLIEDLTLDTLRSSLLSPDLLVVGSASEAAGHHELPLHLLRLHLCSQVKERGCLLIHLHTQITGVCVCESRTSYCKPLARSACWHSTGLHACCYVDTAMAIVYLAIIRCDRMAANEAQKCWPLPVV